MEGVVAGAGDHQIVATVAGELVVGPVVGVRGEQDVVPRTTDRVLGIEEHAVTLVGGIPRVAVTVQVGTVVDRP